MAVTKEWLKDGKAVTVTLTYAKADVFNGQPAIGQKYDPGHEGLPIWSVQYKGQSEASVYWKIGSNEPLAAGQEITIHARKDTNGDKAYFKAFTPEQYAKETAPKGGFGNKTYTPPSPKAGAWPVIYAAVLQDLRKSHPDLTTGHASLMAIKEANMAYKLMEV